MSERRLQSGFAPLGRLRIFTRILSGGIIVFTLFILLGHILFPEPTVDNYPWIENVLPMLMGISVLGLALAWRREMLGGALSLLFFLFHMLLYWIIRGRFFPIGGLLLFSPLPLTALLFLYLGRADSSRLVNKSVNDRSHLLIMVLDIRMKRHHLDQGDL